MKLSAGEKLILVMLADLHQKLGINGNVNAKLVLDSIFSNQTWSLGWEYGDHMGEEFENPPVVSETVDILSMYRSIENALTHLSPEEDKQLKADTGYNYEYRHFRGFDGNHDPHISVVHHLVESLGRFSELKDKNTNSHSQSTLPKYQKMLKVYDQCSDTLMHTHLSPKQLTEILNA